MRWSSGRATVRAHARADVEVGSLHRAGCNGDGALRLQPAWAATGAAGGADGVSVLDGRGGCKWRGRPAGKIAGGAAAGRSDDGRGAGAGQGSGG